MKLGKLLATPVRLLNVPARLGDRFINGKKPRKHERVFSKPLDAVAEEIEEAVDNG